MGLAVKDLLGLVVPRDALWEFATLADMYFDQRTAGKLGLSIEDVDERLVEVLIEYFEYDPASACYVHHGIEPLIHAKGGKGLLDGRFDEFWDLYPRRVAKVAAAKSWSKLVRSDAMANEIIRALKKQCSAYGWYENAKFCPHASTWLNGSRWLDEIAEEWKTGAVRVDA